MCRRETHQHTHVPEGNTLAHIHADELAGSESLSYYFINEVSSLQALAPNFFLKFIYLFYFIYLFIFDLFGSNCIVIDPQ